jgi:thiol-disulfide isomerase/thioredoxin
MKVFLLIFFITSSGLVFCQSQKTANDPFINSQKKILVTGRMKNYVPGDDNRFISFRTYNISGRGKDSAAFIKEDGSFEITLSQPFEGDLAFYFMEEFVTLYGTPGEKINLEIDVNKLKSEEDKSKAITIKGKSSAVSRLIMQFKLPQMDSIPAEENWNDSTLSDQVIAKARIKRMKNDLDSLNRWIKKNAVANKIFENWAKNKFMYEAGWDIAFNLFTSKRRSANDQQLFEMLKDIPLENAKALNNSAYYQYLNIVSSSLHIIVNINPAYDSARRLSGKNSVPIYLKKMDQYSSGFARQMMYYNTYILNPTERTVMYADSFDSIIKIPYVQDQMIEKKKSQPFHPFNIVEKLREYKADESIKKRLISLFESNKKNLFVDFWGDWCAPCMREMLHFGKLVNMFKDSELDFLFLGVETSEEKSAEVKKKFNIDAPFIVLNNNEIRILNNILQFHSYPSHFIIGPNGMVKESFGMKINSGDELSKVALDRLKKYSSLWY